ncbi:hypothetical protein G7Y89_g325 [Cudoniella acicularis]|uniref:Chromatin modification-related protein EAF3 n=1 Tax=Cudoniella acicularis TaxID=354080 RepID=A0A8H4RY84_9HELO|nr:hypothetical protein G7Y89_g325 [Cudoniella acicularis]
MKTLIQNALKVPNQVSQKQWDDWVPEDRVRKFTDENRELAAQLHNQMKALQKRSGKDPKGGRRQTGSDMSSVRDSEERHTSVAATGGRGGPRRNRDYDLEHVIEEVDSISPHPLKRSPKKPPVAVKASDGPSTRGSTSLPGWKDSRGDELDMIQFLESDHFLVSDDLIKLPAKHHTYLDANERYLKDPHKYDLPEVVNKVHPKLLQHERNRTDTAVVQHYYSGLPFDRVLPIAGIINPGEKKPSKAISSHKSGGGKSTPKATCAKDTQRNGSPLTIFPNVSTKKSSRANHLAMDNVHFEQSLTGDSQEETFHARPSIKILIPDHLKALLVDDWENVTKNQQLVPLPSAHPVNSILDDYFEYEKPRRQLGSAHADILEEVVAGLKDYFEKCLGRILLYRFERAQYTEVREAWMSSKGELSGKGPGDTYGAEHLCRLLVSLPELIAQTNMDTQSVTRLREELSKMSNWLGRNAEKYFIKEYETPSQQYVEKARGV